MITFNSSIENETADNKFYGGISKEIIESKYGDINFFYKTDDDIIFAGVSLNNLLLLNDSINTYIEYYEDINNGVYQLLCILKFYIVEFNKIFYNMNNYYVFENPYISYYGKYGCNENKPSYNIKKNKKLIKQYMVLYLTLIKKIINNVNLKNSIMSFINKNFSDYAILYNGIASFNKQLLSKLLLHNNSHYISLYNLNQNTYDGILRYVTDNKELFEKIYTKHKLIKLLSNIGLDNIRQLLMYKKIFIDIRKNNKLVDKCLYSSIIIENYKIIQAFLLNQNILKYLFDNISIVNTIYCNIGHYRIIADNVNIVNFIIENINNPNLQTNQIINNFITNNKLTFEYIKENSYFIIYVMKNFGNLINYVLQNMNYVEMVIFNYNIISDIFDNNIYDVINKSPDLINYMKDGNVTNIISYLSINQNINQIINNITLKNFIYILIEEKNVFNDMFKNDDIISFVTRCDTDLTFKNMNNFILSNPDYYNFLENILIHDDLDFLIKNNNTFIEIYQKVIQYDQIYKSRLFFNDINKFVDLNFSTTYKFISKKISMDIILIIISCKILIDNDIIIGNNFNFLNFIKDIFYNKI